MAQKYSQNQTAWKTLLLVIVVLLIFVSTGCVLAAPFLPTSNHNKQGPPICRPNNILQEMSIPTKPIKPKHEIIVYAGNDQTGASETLTWDYSDDPTNPQCKDLPDNMHKKVRSVNTSGTCVSLCEGLNCQGWCIKFHPNSPSHGRLRKLRFQNRAKSAIPCEPDE